MTGHVQSGVNPSIDGGIQGRSRRHRGIRDVGGNGGGWELGLRGLRPAVLGGRPFAKPA